MCANPGHNIMVETSDSDGSAEYGKQTTSGFSIWFMTESRRSPCGFRILAHSWKLEDNIMHKWILLLFGSKHPIYPFHHDWYAVLVKKYGYLVTAWVYIHKLKRMVPLPSSLYIISRFCLSFLKSDHCQDDSHTPSSLFGFFSFFGKFCAAPGS